MKKILALSVLLLSALSSFSQTAWTRLSDIPVSRINSTSFAIDSSGKGYIIGGFGFGTYLKDTWEYNPATDIWTQKADYPDNNSVYSVGFSLNGAGYVGTGQYSQHSFSNVFYKYTPSTNTWTAIAHMPAQMRSAAVAFTLNGKAYVGAGSDDSYGAFQDFYSYNPVSDTWDTIADFPGNAVSASSFSVGNKGYVGCGGYSFDGVIVYPGNDFWEYDPAVDTWTAKKKFPGPARFGAVGFTISDNGYIGLGSTIRTEEQCTNDMWRYNSSLDSWSQDFSFTGGATVYASAFAVNGNAYVGIGLRTSSANDYSADFWKFSPEIPVFSITPNADSVCVGNNITFGFNANFNVKSWLWTYTSGTTTTSSARTVTLPFETTGVFPPITLLVIDSLGDSISAIRNTTVLADISIGTFIHMDTICVGLDEILELDAVNGRIQWQSSLNDTNFTSIPGANNYTYSQAITQETFFRAIVSNGFCSDTTASARIILQDNTVHPFTYSVKGLQVTFNFTPPAGCTYLWNFGDGDTSKDASPVHTFDSSGLYHVCLLVNFSGGCTSNVCSTVQVKAATTQHCNASFTIYPDSITPHHYFVVPNVSGKSPISYAWQWGDGTGGVGDTATHEYASAGFYTICLTILDDTGCTSSYCDSSVYLSRKEGSSTMVSINVVNSIALGTTSVNINPTTAVIFPNPCSTCTAKGMEDLKDIVITDLLGRNVAAAITKVGDGLTLNFPANETGMLLLHNRKTGQVVKFIRE